MVTPKVMYINELCHEVPRFYLVLLFKPSNFYNLGKDKVVFQDFLQSFIPQVLKSTSYYFPFLPQNAA